MIDDLRFIEEYGFAREISGLVVFIDATERLRIMREHAQKILESSSTSTTTTTTSSTEVKTDSPAAAETKAITTTADGRSLLHASETEAKKIPFDVRLDNNGPREQFLTNFHECTQLVDYAKSDAE